MLRKLGKLLRDENGITALETAIILIAFVVVASVFAFTILSAGNLAGIGGFSMKDHTGDNIGVLNAFHRAASRKFALDPHVRNGKRVGGRRTRR